MKKIYLTTVLIVGLYTISSGQTYNTSFGDFTGTTGSANSFFGHSAGKDNLSGYRNSYFGAFSGLHTTIGRNNTFMGVYSGEQTTTGENNIFIGFRSGKLTTSGSGNTFVGASAGESNTIGGNNLYLGNYAGFSNLTGTQNVFIGAGAGYYETGSNKLHINNQAGGNSLIFGDFTTDQIGIYTDSLLERLTVSGAINLGTTTAKNEGSIRFTGDDFEGRVAGTWVSLTYVPNAGGQFRSYNTNLGDSTGTTGAGNSFFGHSAGRDNLSGTRNSFFGMYAGLRNTTGKANSFLGVNSGEVNTTGSNNTFLGHNSGNLNTDGSGNTFVGGRAGYSNQSGGDNVYIGRYAGHDNTVGEKNVFIGAGAGFVETGSNKLHINNQAAGTSLISGDFSTDKVGINAANLLETLTVNGAINIGSTNGLNDGSIRYTGVDFEGRLNGNWESLTAVGAAFDEKEWQDKYNTLEEELNTLKEELENIKVLVEALSSSNDESNSGNNEKNESGIKLGQSVPNPGRADSDVSISYKFRPESKGKIVVYTGEGEVVHTAQLNSRKDVLIIQAGTLSPGNYLYSLTVDGELVTTLRMILK